MAYLKIDNLAKKLGDQQVLDGVNIDVAKGESIVIIGQSGCGKSVLLKHVLRLLSPDSGKVIFDDQDLSTLNSRELFETRQRIGLLFQSAALFDSLTVAENVGLGLKESRRYSRSEIDEIVMSKLELVGKDCPCRGSLELAVWTDEKQISKADKEKLKVLFE